RRAPVRRGARRRGSMDLALLPSPERGAQVALQDLAGAALRQRLGAQLDRLRTLVPAQVLATVADQLFARGLLPRPQDHHRVHALAELVAGDAEDRRLQHGGVGVERGLDLDAVDVLATAHDHVLRAVHQEHITLFVHEAEIAGVHEAAAERLGSGIGLDSIPLHDVRFALTALADIARLTRTPPGIQAAYIAIWDG